MVTSNPTNGLPADAQGHTAAERVDTIEKHAALPWGDNASVMNGVGDIMYGWRRRN